MWYRLRQILSNGLFTESYWILFLIFVVSIFSLSSCINNWWSLSNICNLWLKDFSLNMTAEMMGILLVLFSVNQTVKRTQEKEKRKFQEIAFRQLRYVLRKQIYLLFEMFKAAAEVRPDRDDRALADFFDDTYFNEVKYLDLLATAHIVSPQGDEMDWLDYLHCELLNLQSALGQVVDRYSFYLDSEVVDVMEELSDSVFIRFINSIWDAKNINAIGDRGDLLSACKELLREYATSLLKLVELYNQSAASDRQIIMDRRKWDDWWSHKGRPKIGESRVKLDSPAQ